MEADDNSNNDSNNNKYKGKNYKKGKGKASTLSYPSQTPSTSDALWCNPDGILGVSSTTRQAGAEYLLLDSGAQLHACPIKYPHTASGWMTPSEIQTSRRTDNQSAFP